MVVDLKIDENKTYSLTYQNNSFQIPKFIGGGPAGPPILGIPGGGGGGGGPPPVIGGADGMKPGKIVYDDFSFRKGKQAEESK